MLRCPAAMLGPLVSEIALVGSRVGDVPRPDVVHDGLADLGEVGDEPVHEHQDQEDAQHALRY